MANATAIHGTMIEHGKAPYKNVPENNQSYYVTLNQNGSDKTFWGNGIEDAIKDAQLKNGDVATFIDKGTQAVNVPDKNNAGQFIQTKKRFWEAEKYEPSVALNNSIEVDTAPDLDANQTAVLPDISNSESEIDLSKIETAKVDANKKRTLPQSIENNYIAIAKNRWLSDEKVHFYDKADPKTVAFEDRTTALATSKSDAKTVKSMLDIAQDKGWSAIKIKGDPEFKRQMWIEAQIRGVETKGYKPTEQDVAELQVLQEAKTKNEVTNDHQRSKEINAQKEQDQKTALSTANATNLSVAGVTATAAAAAVIDNSNGNEKDVAMSQEQRQALLVELSKNQDVRQLRESVDLATKNIPNQSWLNDAANNKFENTLIEMNEHSENTGKQFSKDELIEFAKNDINEVGKGLPAADLEAINERLDIEVHTEKFVGYEYKEQIAGRISDERLAEISEQAVINNPEASNNDLHAEIVDEINKDLDGLAEDANWGESNIVLQKGSIAEVYSNSENKPIELTNLALHDIEREAYSEAIEEDWEAVLGGDTTQVQANFDRKIAEFAQEQNFEKEMASHEYVDTAYDQSFSSPVSEAQFETQMEAHNANVAMASVNSMVQDPQNVVDKAVAQNFNSQFEKYEVLHKELEDHRSAETKVDNHKYHNDPEPTPEVYAKSTPEVKQAVINNLAENMTNDTKQLLTDNNIDQKQVERIAEFVNTDITDRATIDASSPKVASPMSDYVQATNAHIIRSLGTEQGVEIANQNSEKMLGDKINVEPLTADKNGRYAEIVSDKLNENKVDKLTIAKAQAIIHDPDSKDVQAQQSFDKYQQRIGEQLYISGYGKDSIKIMEEISDKYHGIDRDTPEFLDTKLGGTDKDLDKQQDNSLSNENKGFKEVEVIEDTKIGEAIRGSKIETDHNSDQAVGIAATRSMIEELYKHDDQKRESALKSIDEATPEILAGNKSAPQIEVKQQPPQVQIQPTKQPDMDRGR